jgi:hypothetical protein
VAEVGLAAIRFYLDGRIYVLEAAPRRAKARADQSSVSDGPIASLGSED